MFAVVLHRTRAASPRDALWAAAAAVYAVVVLGGLVLTDGPSSLRVLLAVPVLSAAFLVLRRGHAAPAEVWATGVMVLVALATGFARIADGNTTLALTALAAPVIAAATWVVGRWPVPCILGAFFGTGFIGTIQIYTPLIVAPFVDLLLIALLLGLVLGWLGIWQAHGRSIRRAAWLWPGVAALLAYVVVSGISILAAESPRIGMESFRVSTWYMAGALLVAYAPFRPGVREQVAKGAIAVAGLVGLFALFRYATGPGGGELAFAEGNPYNYINDELRPFGSFEGPRQLAAFSAIFAPFAFAMALALPGRWRLASIAVLLLMVFGLLIPDVRAAPAAAAPALALVLVLYALSPAFGVKRLAVTLAAGTLAVAGAAGGFVVLLGSKPETRERYTAIFDPETDTSYQGRLYKWRTAMEDIDDKPLGHGLGTAGQTQILFGRYLNTASYDIDSSYLKIGLEQGFAVMVFYVLTLLALAGGLARRALTTTDPVRAGLMISGSGVVVSMGILFYSATFIEGLVALSGWLLVGLGLGQAVWKARPDERL